MLAVVLLCLVGCIAAATYDIVLGVLVPDLSESAPLQQAVWTAISDAQRTLGPFTVQPVFEQTYCNDTGTATALTALSRRGVTSVVGPPCDASCRLTWPILSLQSIPQFSTGCGGLPVSPLYDQVYRVAPPDKYKLMAVELLSRTYGSSAAFIVPSTSGWASLLPTLADVIPTSNWFLYDSDARLDSVLAIVLANPSFAILAFNVVDVAGFVAAVQSPSVALVGLSVDFNGTQISSTSALVSIVLDTSPVANVSQSLQASLVYDATMLACQKSLKPSATLFPPSPGASGLINWIGDQRVRAPLFQVEAVISGKIQVLGTFSLALNGSLVYAIAQPTALWSKPASTTSAPYAPWVLGAICILSACGLAFVMRLFLPPFWLVSIFFDGFDRHKDAIDAQTFQVYTAQEKSASLRRNTRALIFQTGLDLFNLGISIGVFFGFVIEQETNIPRIAIYSIALGSQIAFIPSLVATRMPTILRHHAPKWIQIKPANVSVLDGSFVGPVNLNLPGGRVDVSALLGGLQTTLQQVQLEHLDVANALLRLWLEEVPILGINVYYILSMTVPPPVLYIATFGAMVAMGFKLHLLNRLSELYFQQRGVLFDIAMARLEVKQRRSSYN
ncbi:hypothetical protein LEN26_001174 [Aphanomyces euteiches]|nr:hypothetical protein AeMF1_002507 [Aphanomyces euteiches]KAH9161973.1 hypothetical protein LEN26_001174 [Aphanomyces euteiches]KAH9183282.1 hypothetical protein AeNC1_014744 [Aphanomyces euteiches]